MNQVDFSEIEKLLHLKGNSRLEVRDDVTERIESLKDLFPGCTIHFITSKKHCTEYGEWVEYKVLYKVKKFEDTFEFLSFALQQLGTLISLIGDLKMDSVGLEEVYCKDPYSYYFLIYVLNNGQDKFRENEYEPRD